MATKVSQVYPIYIESSIIDIEKAKESFPEKSQVGTYSSYKLSNLTEDFGQKFWALRKNRAEIDLSFYRDGVMSNMDLVPSMYSNEYRIGRGEFTSRGELLYLSSESSVNTATDTVDGDSIEGFGFFYSYDVPRVNFLEGRIYKNTSTKIKLLAAPKDQGNIPGVYSNTAYLGFDFSENLDDDTR